MKYRKKLIEVALPLDAINKEAAREKSIRHGHPSTLHLWWARRPLAAARAVLFGQLVDDPSSWPELFPTEEAQEQERKRLFGVIEDLVKWENSNNERVINAARLEIARSHARASDSPKAKRILQEPTPELVNQYLATELPPVYDPFAGGGTIPLEAQRLGLRAIASDLNPVAVMINKALIEIPPKFAGKPPVNPEARKQAGMNTWKGAQGLANDVRYYGQWMRDEAFKRIGHLYPEVELPKEYGGGKATVIAWLWARTVASPDPTFKGSHVPLVSNFFLSTKEGKETWVEPVVQGDDYRFEIRTGKPKDRGTIAAGTKLSRGANFKCILSNTPIEPDYIKSEGKARRMGARLMAIVAEGKKGRIYLPPTQEAERIAASAKPTWAPEEALPNDPRNFWTVNYGLDHYADLFTSRQLVALTTFSDLVLEARERVIADAKAAGLAADPKPLRDGGTGAEAYGDAVAVYLSCAVSKATTRNCSLALWEPGMGRLAGALGRQALPMIWTFAETNPFAGAGGDIAGTAASVAEVLDNQQSTLPGRVFQADAKTAMSSVSHPLIATDPPYYDNIGYADLSDFFYVWLRRTLKAIYPDLFATVLVPKAEELIAAPYRAGSKEAAETFFLNGMRDAVRQIVTSAAPERLVSIYYAFKQAEETSDGLSSTGWETFLDGVVGAGLEVTATWPVRTELTSALKKGIAALASSVVLTCRRRLTSVPEAVTRGDFRRTLRAELPSALRALQHGNIAPVDVAQASIGPGMAIFSRYAKVLEADGSPMTVRSALQLINEALDEYLNQQEGEVDSDTRFAVTWFEAHQFGAGAYGDAETLAKARNVAVAGVKDAGILEAAAGKVRLKKRGELPEVWDPAKDKHLTVWEATQHLIKSLEDHGEQAAADLLKALGPTAEKARDLAYRLYSVCERKKWADEARAYNGLVIAWPELERLAQSSQTVGGDPQGRLL